MGWNYLSIPKLQWCNFITDGITYPCRNLSYTMLVKGAPENYRRWGYKLDIVSYKRSPIISKASGGIPSRNIHIKYNHYDYGSWFVVIFIPYKPGYKISASHGSPGWKTTHWLTWDPFHKRYKSLWRNFVNIWAALYDPVRPVVHATKADMCKLVTWFGYWYKK